jgi:class 3 adenylate cyclase
VAASGVAWWDEVSLVGRYACEAWRVVRTQAVTIVFCDLVASTERRARLGDDAFDEFNRELFVVLRDAIAKHGGRETSNAGDGLMVVFPDSVVDAVACASEMHAGARELDPGDPPKLRIGISCGEVAQVGEDYSGMPIVEAARLEAAAAPGQTLANGVVRTLVGTRRGLRFRDIGRLSLKGIPEPLAAVEVLDVVDVALVPNSAETPSDSPPKWRWVVAVTMLAVLFLVGAVLAVVALRPSHGASNTLPQQHAYPVSYVAKACSPSILRQITVPGLVCGTLTVPEDRSKPHGRVVRLDVVRAPAREAPTGDPVFDFGADTLTTSPARDHSEEIQLAERGTNYALQSDPALTCAEYAKIAPGALTKPAGDLTEQHRDMTAIHACFDRWTRAGIDPNQYNYFVEGRDMADLIRALHFTHVHLVSGYVATIGALEVVRELPGVVESLTLQTPIAPGQSSNTDPPKYLSDAFNNYISLCQADSACKTNFPDLQTDFLRDRAQAARSPRLVQGNDGNGHAHAVLLDGDRMTQALFWALSYRPAYPLIAAALAAPPGNAAVDTAIARSVISGNAPLLEPDYPWGAVLSEKCAYEAHTVDPTGSALARETLPQFATSVDDSLQWECASWPVHEIDQTAFNDPSTTVPTLIVVPFMGSGGDPGWTDIFERGLPNATVLTFSTLDGAILQASDPACFAAIRRAFLADPNKPINGTSCERQSPPIQFLASLGG